MWKTRDGYTLTMPLFRVRRMLRRWRQQTRKTGREWRPGDAMRPVATLARYAHRSGLLRGSSAARRFPVFTSKIKDRSYRIYTRPRGPSTFDIVFIRVVRDR
jgi:hypothetical protein